MKKIKVKKLRKFPPYIIGLLQALGVAVYCLLLGGFIMMMDSYLELMPTFLAPALLFVILVFSAGITGSLVFLYPASLALSRKRFIGEALNVLAFTFLYLLIIIAIFIFLLCVFKAV